MLAELPDADAIALVVAHDTLELVAVGPRGWRLELARGTIEHASFQAAAGLVVFYRDRSVWAVDLFESTPFDVELARMPSSAPGHDPSRVLLCVPHRPGSSYCDPTEPLPSDYEPVPEYLAIYWDDESAAIWHAAIDLTDQPDARWDSYEDVALKMMGGGWLADRLDRRQHFASIATSIHGFYDATPLVDGPEFGDRCDDPDDCGKRLPLGASGWDWVVASERGDLFHPSYAVYDPKRERWANWERVVAGTAKWVPTERLSLAIDELGLETYPLFDGGGRVFASPTREQLCWFSYDPQTGDAIGVECAATGGYVAGFLSAAPELGVF